MFCPTKKLGEICEIYQPQTITSNEILTKGPYKVFGANGVIGYYSKYNHEDAEVLVTCRGATCGTINISEPKSWVTGNAMVVHPKNEKILSKSFLYYTLKHSNLLKTITGTGQPQITRNSLAPFQIILPPLDIQKRIVERLDKIAEAQKLNDELIQKSDELFQSLLHKELNPAGKDWKIKKIKDITTVGNGGTPSTKNPKYWNGKNLWLTPRELSGFEDVEIFDTERKISDEGLSNSSATPLPAGTVLFTSRAPIGYVAIAGVPMSTNQGFKNFICDSEQLNNKFLYFFLRLKKKYLQSLGRGATFTEISKTIVEKVEIPLPTIEVQKQIVAKLSVVQDYKKQLLAQKSLLKELFASVLNKSMKREL